ncbi:hypothetical protein GCM10008967_19070 [Bacillus carboniphilus]|uniref:Uncharacterized protein n=1 Tax=Bacillus carboniphilus TaxID=86663 RepID=A0ABN0W8B4_9BACI
MDFFIIISKFYYNFFNKMCELPSEFVRSIIQAYTYNIVCFNTVDTDV